MLDWLKDKTYYKKKVNTLMNELEIQRKAHAQNTIAWTKQIEDLTMSLEYRDTRHKLTLQENRKLKERIKELETPKRKTKKERAL